MKNTKLNMNYKTPIFHGTTAPGITKFKLGIKNRGETVEPIDAIWFGTWYEGAKYHATMVSGPKRKVKFVYVYKCNLDKSCVIADTKRTRIPPRNFKKLVDMYMPWYMRLAYKMGGKVRRKLVPNYQTWFQYVYKVSRPLVKSPRPEDSMNAVIEVCKSIGIDVLVHPNTIPDGSVLKYFDEGTYGKAMLVLNCDKVTPNLQYKLTSA
ncbi:hypothetical protein R7D63_16620 [Vibrio sp. Vb2909]|uniref:hypothetical protein n=2 Tax=Vibrionaceae TaxID=641 RepID=UPI001BD5DCBE|nr:hypothetical protein [Vibrio alginolyticus]MBS9989673.1 hypothetical protein [Vibrio alginolyticus]MCG6235916.1 hypothetical protein [Vibrio diabolicus]MDW1725866.1 hypothetical protein [Vibrio sp. Vb2909]